MTIANTMLMKPSSQEQLRILERFSARTSLGHDDATKAWTELLRFLVACKESQADLTPSKIIDELWHEFILHTRTYARFCAQQLGVFVDHVPTNYPEVANYRKTLGLLEARAGHSLDKRFWPTADDEAADCSSSCSSCGSSCSN